MKTTELRIIPECHVDTKIAEIVGQDSNKYNHQHGCGNVANEMIKRKNLVSLGIVDEDKNKGPRPKFFTDFVVLKEENSLILHKHKERKQYLIFVCPEVEKWLMKDANTVCVDPTDDKYKLPADLKGFTSKCKIEDINNNDGFVRFVKKLLKENAPSITTLKNWIELFKEDRLDSLKIS